MLSPAADARTFVQARATVSLAATENPVNNSGSEGGDFSTDGFVSLSPSLHITSFSSDVIQRFDYRFSQLLYFRQKDLNAYTNQLDYGATLRLTPRTDLAVALTTAQGQQRNVAFLQNANLGRLNLQPTEDVVFISAGLRQVLNHAISPSWTFSQSSDLRGYVPFTDSQPLSLEANASLQADFSWIRDAVGLGTTAGFFASERGFTQAGVALPTRRWVTPTGYLYWLRDLSLRWTSEARAGAVVLVDVSNDELSTIEPSGAVSLRYGGARTDVELSYEHAFQPNLILGSVFLGDQIGVTTRHAFDYRQTWQISGSANYSFSRPIRAGDDVDLAKVHSVDWIAELTWRCRRYLYFSLSYSASMQIPTSNSDQLSQLIQHLFLLNTTVLFPAQPAPFNGLRMWPTRRVSRDVQAPRF